MKPLVVVAIGGNALMDARGSLDVETQRARARDAAAHIGRLADDHRLLVTHGNGPQVGLLAMQATLDPDVAPAPLDVIDAESIGLVGYLLVEALSHRLAAERIVSVLTRVEVDPADPALAEPTKPVGPWFPEERGVELAAMLGWTTIAGPSGRRRVVASPEPLAVVEMEALRSLSREDFVLVAGGGGGVPVVASGDGFVGVEAVVDKDATSALLATGLDAERLVILTDVDGIHVDHGGPRELSLSRTTPSELRRHEFEPGSMAPKVEAVCRFVEATGRPAAVGHLASASDVLAGAAGTVIRPD